MLSRDEKLRLVKSVPFWWHTIDFGDGIASEGHCPKEAQKIRASVIPKNLKGKTVLDVGCWDGFFSFLCEQRGAKVLAIDNGQHAEFVRSKFGIEIAPFQGFKIAKRILNSDVRFKQMDFFELENTNKKFDIVLFMGILYHLKYPFRALEILRKLTRELAIIETHYLNNDSKTPLMRFYPSNELKDDPTVWWGPNIACIKAMLSSVGFSRVRIIKKYFAENDNRVLLYAYP